MNPTQYPASLKAELKTPATLKRGQRGIAVKRAQEWLSYHGFATMIDADFGDATERAVTAFRAKSGLGGGGTVDADTWAALIAPLASAVADTAAPGRSLPRACLKTAQQHLKLHPVELGGDNAGPWVRAYMDGNDGPQWYWCAGFVTFVLKQAALQVGMPLPVPGSFSCDSLAAQAKKAGRFVAGADIAAGRATADQVGECFIFLRRRTPDDWTHTGFGFQFNGNTFSTIEGNTNDDGNRNGYEVCSRTASMVDKDFIVLG